MARKKNLERAIILGLILSTGVYGSAWAAEVTTGDFEDAANVPIEGISVDGNNYTVSKDTTINGNTTGSALNWSWLGNKVITVENNANLTFNGIQLNNSTIKGNGNVTVENDNGGLAVFVGSNIQANTLTLNTTNGNGIYLYEHDLTLDVEHLVINCTQNGIIQEVSEGDIPLTKPVTVTIDDTQSININSSGYWALRNNAQSGVINNDVNFLGAAEGPVEVATFMGMTPPVASVLALIILAVVGGLSYFAATSTEKMVGNLQTKATELDNQIAAVQTETEQMKGAQEGKVVFDSVEEISKTLTVRQAYNTERSKIKISNITCDFYALKAGQRGLEIQYKINSSGYDKVHGMDDHPAISRHVQPLIFAIHRS